MHMKAARSGGSEGSQKARPSQQPRSLSLASIGLVSFLGFSLLLLAQDKKDLPAANPFSSPADVEQGKHLFGGQCAPCHGPAGDGGRGANLAQPNLPRAANDGALFTVIRYGLPGTEMPNSHQMSDREVWQLAAFVRTLGRVREEKLAGSPERGAQLFRSRGGCLQCHTVAGEGGGLGPALSEIGLRRTPAFLRRTLDDPALTLPEDFLWVSLVTRQGQRISGVRLHEDTFTIQVRAPGESLHSFFKDELTEIRRSPGSTPMPAYKGTFSEAEREDVVAYLASLQGVK